MTHILFYLFNFLRGLHFFRVRRKGTSLIESLLLIIILLVAIGAIFQTLGWMQRVYASGRQERDSREVLFNWVQTFESMWPPAGMSKSNPLEWKDRADDLIGTVGGVMGAWDTANRKARIDGFTVTAVPGEAGLGSMEIQITIEANSRTWVNLTRSYNVYTTETVSDDLLQEGA